MTWKSTWLTHLFSMGEWKGALRKNGLTHFMPLISFDTSWKHQKTRGFLMFSGVSIEISGMKWVNEKLRNGQTTVRSLRSPRNNIYYFPGLSGASINTYTKLFLAFNTTYFHNKRYIEEKTWVNYPNLFSHHFRNLLMKI